MKPGWYILEYHHVDWIEEPVFRILRGTIPPDIFEAHIRQLRQVGEIVSVPTALNLVQSGQVRHPIFSLWFDDGYVSVRKQVWPICQRFGIQGAVSLCSRFWRKEEVFWRFQFAALSYTGVLHRLKQEFLRWGWNGSQELRELSIQAFSPELLKKLDEWMAQYLPHFPQKKLMEVFDSVEGLSQLQRDGWVLANHTSAHYPVSEPQGMPWFAQQFLECEEALRSDFGQNSQFWVLPFDRPRYRDSNLLERFYQTAGKDQFLVLVGNGINQPENVEKRILFRIHISFGTGKNILKHIRRNARPGKVLVRQLLSHQKSYSGAPA